MCAAPPARPARLDWVPVLPPPARALGRLFHPLDASLRARILLPTAVLFALTLAGMTWAALEFHEISVRNMLRERAQFVADTMVAGVAETMAHAGADRVEEVLAGVVSSRRDILAVSLARPDGRVVFSSDHQAGRQIAVPHGATTSFLVGDPGRSPQGFALVHPVGNRPECADCHARSPITGWVEVRFANTLASNAQRQMLHALVGSVVPAFLLLLAIAWWLVGREAVAPLGRLVRAMRRAGAGEVVQADEGRPDEIGAAARCADAAFAALRRSHAELEAFYHERLVRADRFAALGELATGLAHEIKNPLAGLSGALELLEEDLAASPQREVVGEMRHQVARLGRTMEALLGFARPARPRLAPLDVDAVLDKVLFLVRQQRCGGPLEIVRVPAPGTPPVLGDASQLEQVFLNICLNSCQALGPRGGRLELRTLAGHGRTTVEIADNGPGIPEAARPQLFQPFFTTRRDGTGLGLAISARIVSDHGGQISYRCPPEGGTVFSVTLPHAGVARAAADTVLPSGPPPAVEKSS